MTNKPNQSHHAQFLIFIASRLLVFATLAQSQTTTASPPSPETIRADFLKLIDRPKVPPAVEFTATPTTTTTKPTDNPATFPLIQFHFTYASDSTHRVPGILLEPASISAPQTVIIRHPVVILLHGTGGTKTDELPLMRQLANRGFITVAVDAPYHGERSKAGKGTAEYTAAIFKAWQNDLEDKPHEHPFYFDTVWEQMRLIDYLQSRPDVDPNRIGLYGVSKGGIETYLTAAIDTRVAAAVPCIGLESFRWALDNDSWHSRIGTIQKAFDDAAKESNITNPTADFVHQFYNRVSPGIDAEFDGPSLVNLIAPRPLFPINGDSDAKTPLPGLKLCTDAAQQAYKNTPDHFQQIIEPHAGHTVTKDSQKAAVAFFTKWLNPASTAH